MKLHIGVSYASAVELGLARGRLEARPTTLYLFLKEEGCSGKCLFCPQSGNGNADSISRVKWPDHALEDIENRLSANESFQRVCLQCSDEPAVRESIAEVARRLYSAGKRPITVSSPPIQADLMADLKDAGADTITIPLDCANDALFRAIKGREPEGPWHSFEDGLRIFGAGKVGTHIIIGLGESERDAVLLIGKLFRMGIIPSLFAFTPVRGAFMENGEPPDIASYRRLQLARHLIVEIGIGPSCIEFNENGRVSRFLVPKRTLEAAFADGGAFMVHGCPGCNRPYFNERVSGPLYNYAKRPAQEDIARIKGELLESLEGS